MKIHAKPPRPKPPKPTSRRRRAAEPGAASRHDESAAAPSLLVAGARRCRHAGAPQTIYRCGNEYTQTPCADGKLVDVGRRRAARSSAPRRAQVARREKRLPTDWRASAERRSARPSRRAQRLARARRRGRGCAHGRQARRSSEQAGSAALDEARDFVAAVPKAKKPAADAEPATAADGLAQPARLGLQAPVLRPQRLAAIRRAPGRPGCKPPGRPARTAARRSGRRTRCSGCGSMT